MTAPLISIVMATYNTAPTYLAQAIESVLEQDYPHWELCIADDASPSQAVHDVLQQYAAKDDRIRLVLRKENGRVSAALNSALELATGEWIAVLDHDDLLSFDALRWVADAISRHPDIRLIHTDEDKLNSQGEHCSPMSKPAWNRAFFRSHGTVFHLGVHHAQLVRKIGGFRIGMEGSHGYDLALRCLDHIVDEQIHHIPRVLYHWRMPSPATVQTTDDYAQWIKKFDTLDDVGRDSIRSSIAALSRKPLISILLAIDESDPAHTHLAHSIASIKSQLYPHWELCQIDTACLHTAAALNQALAQAHGEWAVLLRAQDTLSEDALFRFAEAIDMHSNAELLYADEDKIDGKGFRLAHWFKCNWNRDLFYSQNLIGRSAAYRVSLLRELGGFNAGCAEAYDYDLALRYLERIDEKQIVHIPRVLYHERLPEDMSSGEASNIPVFTEAGVQALNAHLLRRGIDAQAELSDHGYRVRYALPDSKPLASIIIPTRNAVDLVKKCIESIESKTTYHNYEIILVDNGSDDPLSLSYFTELARKPGLRVLKDARPFNYSALNNAASKVACGDILVLLNNDVEVITPNWLDELVSIALQPGVGAVSGKLLYPDETVQHAGIVLADDSHMLVGQVFRNFSHMHPGYAGWACLMRGYSALIGACLAMKKSIYDEVRGLNEEDLIVGLNDIDLCLRFIEKGYRNVWTPNALLYHHESASRGLDCTPEKLIRLQREIAYIRRRWGKFFEAGDPAYSPNLTAHKENMSLAWPPRI
ncbi:glycosyltransferase [Comamonas sp. Y6]|nr:glycosyltransferase [Comamonas resistens]MDL5039210.1 glycosyltransferase [Comamonas resistens]